jgi:hypothetical protein
MAHDRQIKDVDLDEEEVQLNQLVAMKKVLEMAKSYHDSPATKGYSCTSVDGGCRCARAIWIKLAEANLQS